MSDSSSHTGRELELMLAGQKPLAMFYAEAAELPWEEVIPEEAFAPCVKAGQVVRRDIDMDSVGTSGRSVVIRYVFYALPGHEWRIHLMTVLKRALYSGAGWNETCERMEGALLGYTEEENDAHCLRVFNRDAP